MSRYFSFRWARGERDPTTTLVLASTASTFDYNEVKAVLDADHGADLHPDRLCFVVPTLGVEAFVEAARQAVRGERLLRMGIDRITVSVAPYDRLGTCAGFEHVAGPEADWRAEDFDLLRARGLLEIFERRDVLVRALPGTHFVHPRGVHSLSFLRGANAFVSGAEVGFMAMTLLRHLSDDVVQVWLDTSSIASVAYALALLRKQMDPGFDPPHVDSFSSYEKLRTTKFEHPRKSLFLISATASGDMAREIVGRDGIGRDQVVNLFSSAPVTDDLTVHCDVREHPSTKGRHGESLLGVFPAATCPWCRDESRLVRFVSDQFLADQVETRSVLIREGHAPKGTKDLFKVFRQRGGFALADDGEGESHRFLLDADLLRDEAGVAEGLEAAVLRYAPVATSHVVSAGDPASDRMAEDVADQVGARARRRPEVVAPGQVARLARGSVEGVVVAAACVGSGVALQDISRDLRDVMDDGPRTYVIGIEKHAERQRHDTLVNDLAHNKVYKNQVVSLRKLVLPEKGVTAWTSERRLLEAIEAQMEEPDGARFVEGRLEVLRRARLGGADDLFLPTPSGARLELRPGFAFWHAGYDPGLVSHGDVLATMATVMHEMRTLRIGSADPELSPNPFRSTVVAPETFARYNDGVIQAAILRSARPHELNYGSETGLSGAMFRIVRRALERWASSQGEAVLEFLLAIATRRVVLTGADHDRLAAMGPPDGASPSLAVLFDAAVRDAPSR